MHRFSLFALFLLGACAGVPEDAPRTVPAVDLHRYAGTWYEIARFPNRFEDGPGIACTDVTATYTPRPDGRIGGGPHGQRQGQRRLAARRRPGDQQREGKLLIAHAGAGIPPPA